VVNGSDETESEGFFSTPCDRAKHEEPLGRLIFGFVDNPFFKEESVVDTQLTTKTRRDLEDIIELSKQIKKRSDRFAKEAP